MPVTTNIQGTSGSWSATVTPNADGTRDRITISYTPTQNPNGCQDIRLIQCVSSSGTKQDGTKVEGNGGVYDQNPFRHGVPDTVTVSGKEWYVDHSECEGDPFYNGSDRPQDTPSAGNTQTPRATTMSDTPGTNPGRWKSEVVSVTFHFRVCAVCVASGEVLDCMCWEMTAARPADGAAVDQGNITVQSSPCPDDGSFGAALRKFVQNHTRNDKNGKTHWYCPDEGGQVMGPEGAVVPRIGGEVPAGFGRRWLEPRPAAPPPITPDPGKAGTRPVSVPRRVLLDAARAPERAGVKFTWAGTQTKSRPSVLFSPLSEIDPERLSTLLPTLAGLDNDYFAILHVRVSPDWMGRLLRGLKGRFGAEGEAGDEGDAKETIVGVFSGLDGAEAAAFHRPMGSATVSRLMQRMGPHPDTDEHVLRMLQYAARNLGRPHK